MENNKVDIDKMSEQSGESNLMGAPRYELPIVRLQGKDGIFQRITKDNEGKSKVEELGDTIKGTTLKFRRILSSFSDKQSYFSNEHNSFQDNITLFQSETDSEGKRSTMMVDEGTAKEIKERKQNLKMTQVVYFLMDKEVVKLQIKGSSLKNFYEFRQEIKKKENKHFFQFVIEIEKTKIEGKLGVYYTMEFSIKEEIKDLGPVAEKIEEVTKKLEEIENYYKDKGNKEPGEEAAEAIEKQIKEEKEEEIEVNQIPFE